jgi:hypothetical protein
MLAANPDPRDPASPMEAGNHWPITMDARMSRVDNPDQRDWPAWPAIKLLFRNRRLSDSKRKWGNMTIEQQSDGNSLYDYITHEIYGNILDSATPAEKTALDLIKKADIAARFLLCM